MQNLNYGIIGNCRSAALISDKGNLDWCCLPDFDSSSIFAKLLDTNIGGSFEIIVDEHYTIKQSYIKNTAVLCTRFSKGDNVFEIHDFMPRYKAENNERYNPPDIVRYLKLISGKPQFKIKYDAKLEFARHNTIHFIEEDYIKSQTTEGEYDSLYLYSNLQLEDILNQNAHELNEDSFILMSYNQKLLNQTTELQNLKLQKTLAYWLDWSYQLTSYSQYQPEIIRSALTLKLLSYDKTGAVLAAATTSLPESIGDVRNWDYRFCWIRDSSMVINIMNMLGKSNTVERFINFIIDIIPDKDEKIQIMYGINRQKQLNEETLEHLAGYENSTPVRIGNAAYTQKQNDIFGVLMDVILQRFQLFTTSLENSEYLWTITRSIVKTVEKNWQKPDKGIWEIRAEDKHFTFSKVLCWVAIDRAISIARIIRKKKLEQEWIWLANKIKGDILENAWNEKVQSFTQYYGSEDQDAANLLMGIYGFIDTKDEKYISTVKAIEKELCHDGLMYRYKNSDDFGIPSSSFTICTFWLINSLNAIGEKSNAKKMFNKLLTYSNHLGLFSEDLDFKTKRLLGNFPQAYSHLALIETAINLSKGVLTEDEKVLEGIHG
ncbi:MAG: glycoside hydrolase family 15 protein [Salinivirgaceae bacterium]|nr:glycoside hydrolase family 15 protein [Salinivirgaceae bacterium]